MDILLINRACDCLPGAVPLAGTGNTVTVKQFHVTACLEIQIRVCFRMEERSCEKVRQDVADPDGSRETMASITLSIKSRKSSVNPMKKKRCASCWSGMATCHCERDRDSAWQSDNSEKRERTDNVLCIAFSLKLAKSLISVGTQSVFNAQFLFLLVLTTRNHRCIIPHINSARLKIAKVNGDHAVGFHDFDKNHAGNPPSSIGAGRNCQK